MDSLKVSHLVYHNLRRKPYRAIVIGLCVAVASGTLFFASIIFRGIQTSLSAGQARMGADLIVVPAGKEISTQEAFITGEATSFTMSAGIVADISHIEGVAQVSPQIFITTLTNAKCCIGEFFLVGYDPDTDFTISPWLATNLNGDKLGDFDVIAGDRILLREGDAGAFYGTVFNVVGVLEKTGMGIDRTIYVPMAGMRVMITDSQEKAEKTLEISLDEISTVMVKVEEGVDILDVAERIEAQFEGIEVVTSSHLNQAVGKQIRGVMGTMVGITIVVWLMSLVTIGLVFSLIVNERRRELGLFRAMGARQSFIFRIVVSEASMLTGIGGIGGLLVSGILLISFSRLIQKQLGIPYLSPGTWEVVGLEFTVIVLALVIGVLASLQPAFSSSRMEPYEAIRRGE